MTDQPTTHDERPHAERSSSQLPSLIRCPGYKPNNDRPKHWVTKQGERCHLAMDTGEDTTETGFEAKMVQLCEDYVATLPPCDEEHREIRVETVGDRWGYVDRLRLRRVWIGDSLIGTRADVVDFKFGFKEVDDGQINMQGIDYVIGVFDRYPEVFAVGVHFPMPRLGTVTVGEFLRADLPRLQLEVLAVLSQAKRTDMRRIPRRLLKPDYNLCRFCARCNTGCPALYDLFSTIARRYDPEALPEIPDELHASKAEDPKTLAQLKALATVAETWAKSVSFHVTQKVMEKGIEIPGYVVDYRKGRRTVTRPLALLDVAAKHGLTVNDVLEESTPSLSSLEQRIRDRAPRGKKDEAVAAFLCELLDADAYEPGEDTAFLKKTTTTKNKPDQPA